MHSDQSIIERILAGHTNLYAHLVTRYERIVHAAAWAILHDHHAAQDITQDTFLKAYKNLATLRTSQTFAAWLLTITRNAATDIARARHRLITVPSLPEITAADPPPSTEEDSSLLLAAIANLAPQDQHLLFLRYFTDLPVATIAAILASPVGTITKQLSRAITNLRQTLKENP